MEKRQIKMILLCPESGTTEVRGMGEWGNGGRMYLLPSALADGKGVLIGLKPYKLLRFRPLTEANGKIEIFPIHLGASDFRLPTPVFYLLIAFRSKIYIRAASCV